MESEKSEKTTPVLKEIKSSHSVMFIISGCAMWLSDKKTSYDCDVNQIIPEFYVDPNSHAWSRLAGGWCQVDVRGGANVPNYPVEYIQRRNLLKKNPPFYITQGHYDEHSDILLEYVKNGGGLIIGGHAWWWALQEEDPNKSALLEHPGNKFLTNFGLAFSRESVDDKDAAFPIKTKEVPSIKVSRRNMIIYSLI